jgi:hypothetical protein
MVALAPPPPEAHQSSASFLVILAVEVTQDLAPPASEQHSQEYSFLQPVVNKKMQKDAKINFFMAGILSQK